MGLTPTSKRDRPQNVPRDLVVIYHDAIIQNDAQEPFSSDDESGARIFNIVLGE